LTLRWTAGHSDIAGNEQVDADAKMAAAGTTSKRLHLPPCLRKSLPQSASAIKQAANDNIKAKWKRNWKKSPRYDRYRKL
ncbi:hypothetical protein BC834DRAFT_801889, partial [Gloeopeniophorella convolvens]